MRLAKGFFLLFLLLECVTLVAVRNRRQPAEVSRDVFQDPKCNLRPSFAVICFNFIDFDTQKSDVNIIS